VLTQQREKTPPGHPRANGTSTGAISPHAGAGRAAQSGVSGSTYLVHGAAPSLKVNGGARTSTCQAAARIRARSSIESNFHRWNTWCSSPRRENHAPSGSVKGRRASRPWRLMLARHTYQMRSHSSRCPGCNWYVRSSYTPSPTAPSAFCQNVKACVSQLRRCCSIGAMRASCSSSRGSERNSREILSKPS